jgi:hypothetical protein
MTRSGSLSELYPYTVGAALRERCGTPAIGSATCYRADREAT